MGRACGAYGGGEGGVRVLVGKPEGNRPLGRPRRRWMDNIRMDLQEVGCGYVDWIRLAQDRDRWRTLVSAVMNLRVLWNEGKFLSSCKPVSFSRRTLHHGVSTFITLISLEIRFHNSSPWESFVANTIFFSRLTLKGQSLLRNKKFWRHCYTFALIWASACPRQGDFGFFLPGEFASFSKIAFYR